MMTPDFSRYLALVSDLAQRTLPPADVAAAQMNGAQSVMLAIPAARLLLRDDPSLYPALVDAMRTLEKAALLPAPSVSNPGVSGGVSGSASGNLSGGGGVRFVDPAGHWREVYHPLALHLCLWAFSRRYESLPTALWSVCESVTSNCVIPCRQAEAYVDAPPPPGLTTLTLWHTLCLADQATLLRRDADIEMIDSVVHAIASRPGPDGALHPRGDEESLDAWTYRELAGLHALANLALLRRNQSWARRVEQVAMHHLENTQPDNTTNQPWAVFAFLWSQMTRSFAEQQLHDTAAHGTGTVAAPLGSLAGLLLADAADALFCMTENAS